MRRTIKQLSAEVFEVDSEPGDATRYQFLVYRDGPDEFCFCPTRSTFKFPQRINWWDVKHLSCKDAMEFVELAKEHNCNPHTFKECVEVIHIIKGGE